MKRKVLKMSKQATVLETIKSTAKKGGMTSAQIKLAEAQSEDYADMKREIQEIRTDISDVKSKMDNVENKVNNVDIQLAEMKGTLNILVENIKLKQNLLNNKYFWVTLGLVITLFAGVTHISELAHLLGK